MTPSRRVRQIQFMAVAGVLLLSVGAVASAAPSRAEAITLNPAEAPIPLLSTPVPQLAVGANGGTDSGVVEADTAGGPAQSTGPSPVILLIAALGLLVGVLLVTRPRRRGPP
jgi:lysozyme family protein